jgi:hypothetical protein
MAEVYKYRVLDATTVLYEGNDLAGACAMFQSVLPTMHNFQMRSDSHSVTGEPMVEVRHAETGRMVAALYGASREELLERLRK